MLRRCPKQATTTRCRRRATAARWCAPPRHRADLQRLPPPPGGDAARARQHAVPTSSARCTAGPTTCTASSIGAPHFEHDPCLNLNRYPLTSGTACCSRPPGATPRARPGRAGAAAPISTSAATCSTARCVHECDYNWKTFIEVYLEDYHVGPFHPGPGQLRLAATTCAGRWATSTRCRRWAWPTAPARRWARPARPSTRPGRSRC